MNTPIEELVQILYGRGIINDADVVRVQEAASWWELLEYEHRMGEDL